ncbi:response regulator transcription factor [Yeosuana sp.]|uniref:response regulator transcription factor n=1 Tax=Yeosuana sp. TaxID=2529388 RepID=UPI004048F789
MKPQVLIIDADTFFSKSFSSYLRNKNIEVVTESDVLVGLKKLQSEFFNLCIIDLRNDKKGIKKICLIARNIPVFCLSSTTSKSMIIFSYKEGVHDYILKKTDFDIIYIKISLIISKTFFSFTEFNVFDFDQYNFNYSIHTLTYKQNNKIHLTPIESKILKLLLFFKNENLDSKFLQQCVWRKADYFTSKCLEVYINRLRKIFSDNTNVKILTMNRTGYMLEIVERF